MGAAAFRHCCELGANTLLVGPDEPTDSASHTGVFGAHYDQARLTHLHGKSDVWGELGRRSIEQYRHIESVSGIEFYQPVGELFVADRGAQSHYHDPVNIERSRRTLGVELEELDDSGRQDVFPYLAFPDSAGAVWETRPAGYVNPRALIQAEVAIGVGLGGSVVCEQVATIGTGLSNTTVTTTTGDHHETGRVLLAAGSFSNAPGLLPRPLPLTLKTEFVVLGRVCEEEAERLAAMPVIHYDLEDETLADIYLVPPVRYPDGHHYIKLGANTVADRFLETVPEMCDWYARGDSDLMLTALRAAILAIVPGLETLDWHTSRCVITRTPNQLPIIDAVVPDRLYVSVGGNGSSAYCSDAIGKLAANLTVNAHWSDDLAHRNFRHE
jgi:glycine/D-amino acid oxidase-like deaminating enzyme